MDRFEIGPFAFKTLPLNEVRDQWVRWKRNFQYAALASGETSKSKLKYILLARAGPDLQDVFQTIPGADVEEKDGVDPYAVALEKTRRLLCSEAP